MFAEALCFSSISDLDFHLTLHFKWPRALSAEAALKPLERNNKPGGCRRVGNMNYIAVCQQLDGRRGLLNHFGLRCNKRQFLIIHSKTVNSMSSRQQAHI